MKFKYLTVLLCLTGLFLTRGFAAKPNVILIITDDQGYGDIGAHGNKDIITPNLDKLHGQSVRLTNFHVDPTCAPTRSALLTGRYSGRVGVWHTIMGRSLLRKDETTMADVFGANGYETAMFGKWHLGDTYPYRPQHRGFKHTLVHGGGGVGQTPDYYGNDYFDDHYLLNGIARKYEGYCTDVWFNGAIDFARKNKKNPFFIYLSTNAPHGPFFVADKYKAMYAKNSNVPNPAFWGMITNIDENMGRLMKFLDDEGLADNTILIFMTDNGTAAGFRGGKGFNAGMKGTKGSQFDGGHRVPFFVRWPAGGLTGGRDINRLAAHLDVLPTLKDLCQLAHKPKNPIDGTSLQPLLKGKADGWPARTLVVESQRIEHPEKGRNHAVMTDKWRLINNKQLFDMAGDPGQNKDVAAEHPEVVKSLNAHYDKWWTDVSKRHNEYCPLIIGSEAEPISVITAHDWHGKSVPWNHNHIRSGTVANGFWSILVEKPGNFSIALRRWPIEVDRTIRDAHDGKAIDVQMARLKIQGFNRVQTVNDDTKEVVFNVKLKAGETKMETSFLDDKGKDRGAYYVYVTRLN